MEEGRRHGKLDYWLDQKTLIHQCKSHCIYNLKPFYKLHSVFAAALS